MARRWGNWTSTSPSNQRFRLGVDYSVSGTKITINYYVLEAAFPINQPVLTLDRQQGLTGTRTTSANTSGGVVNLGQGGSVTGSRGSSVRFRARTTNIYNGLNPSFNFTIAIPAAAPSKPAAPKISNIGTTTATATLSSAPASNGASISRYEWELEGGTNPANTTGRTRSLSGLTANKSYRVRVRARNSAGTSTWSNWSSSFTTKPLDPSAATGVTATRVTDARVDVGWTRNVSATRPITSQRVERMEFTSSGGWGNWTSRGTVSGTATSFADTGVTTNKQYRYRIVAINSGGSTASTHSLSVRTTPAAPTLSTAEKIGNDLRVTYSPNTPYSDYLTHILQDSPNGGAWVTVTTQEGTAPLTHSNPDPAQTHRYRVITRSTYGGNLDSPPSNLSTVIQLQAPPLAPVITSPGTGIRDTTQVVPIGWLHEPVDGSTQVKATIRYRIGTSGTWTTFTVMGAASSWDAPAPNVEGVFQFQVSTWGDHPTGSPWSAVRSVPVGFRPAVVINSPTPGTLPTSQVDLEWGYSQGAGSPQVAWAARLFDDETGALLEDRQVSSSAESGALVAVLDDATTYRVEMRVWAANGLWSEWDAVTFTTDFPLPVCYETETLWDGEAGAVGLTFSTDAEPVQYAWTGTPDESTSTRTTADGTVTNMFTNPDMVATEGEVVVWENRSLNPRGLTAWGSLSNATYPIQDREDSYSPIPGVTSVRQERTGNNPSSTIGKATFVGASSASSANSLPVTGGETISSHMWLACERNSWRARVTAYFIDSLNQVLGSIEDGPVQANTQEGWFRYSATFEVPNGAVKVRFTYDILTDSGGAEEGESTWFCGHTVAPIPEFFDETFSPDPDLTPQPRPGGGSQLVGKAVAGMSASNGVVIQSTQWSKNGGVSARLIKTSGSQHAFASRASLSGGKSYLAWRYQEGVLDQASNNFGTMYVTGPFGTERSNRASNETGETLLTLHRENTGGTLVVYGSRGLGESVWFDLLTVTDTEGYDGPPFSGSSQSLVEADYLTVMRQDEGGEPVVVADFIDPETSVVDPLPGIGLVEYWAISRTTLPSSNTCESTIVPLFDGTLRGCPKPVDGIPVYSAWLNTGADYGEYVRAFYDLVINEPEVGLVDRVEQRYSGRAYPIEISGVAQVQNLDVTFTVGPDGETRKHGRVSTVEEWRAMARRPAPFWWRDHTGRKFQCSIRPIAITPFPGAGGHYAITLQVTRIDEEPFLIEGDVR